MLSREAPAVMNLLKALSLLASDALVRTPVANSDVQSRLILEMTGDGVDRLQSTSDRDMRFRQAVFDR
jgi:hypothetical protein